MEIPGGTSEFPIELLLTLTEDDLDEEMSETIVISARVSSIADPGKITLTILDDDTSGLLARQTQDGVRQTVERLRVREGESVSYTLELTAQPVDGNPVMVSLTVTGDGADDVTITGELSFSPLSDWNEPRLVTVMAGVNSGRNDVRELSIMHTVNSGDERYDTLPDVELPLTLTDPGVVISSTSLTLDEKDGMTTDSYEVKLTSQPSADVVVDLTLGGATGVILLDPRQLTFTATDWDTVQSVRVTAVDDVLSNGQRTAIIGHTITTEDTNYQDLVLDSVEVTIEDDEPVPGVTLVLVPDRNEEGSSDDGMGETEVQLTVRVVLAGPRRSSETTLTLSIGGGADDAIEGTDYRTDVGLATILIIPATEQQVELEVILTLTPDRVDEDDESFTVAITADLDPQAPLTSTAALPFTIEDDDTSGLALRAQDGVQPVSSLRVLEGGSVTYSLVLTSQPLVDVVVMLSVTGDEDNDVTITEERTFTASDWDQPQEVTVAAAVNDDTSEVRDISIVHTVTAGDVRYLDLADVELPLTLSDVDVIISPLSLTLAETGGGGSYEVVLTSRPSSDVVVDLTLRGATEAIRLDNQQLTFTVTDWATSQMVSVTGVDDDLSNGQRTAIIGHTITTEDTNYQDLVLDSVEVTIIDNEPVPGVRLVLVPDRHLEGGSDDGMGETEVQLTVRVVLDGPMRSTTTTLALSIGGGDDDSAIQGMDMDYLTDVGPGTILTIPARTQEVLQLITLTLFQDRIDELDETFIVAITAEFDTETSDSDGLLHD